MIVNDYLKDFWHNRRDRKWAMIIQIWAFSLFEQWNHLWESSFLTRSKSSWRFFSVVPIFAIRFHVYVLHQKHQSWVGFIRFCFSTFASHHWLVGDRRQFFPSLVVVFPPLVIVVFFSLIDLLFSAMIFGFWAKSIFDSIFEWSQTARIVFLENVGLAAIWPKRSHFSFISFLVKADWSKFVTLCIFSHNRFVSILAIIPAGGVLYNKCSQLSGQNWANNADAKLTQWMHQLGRGYAWAMTKNCVRSDTSGKKNIFLLLFTETALLCGSLL